MEGMSWTVMPLRRLTAIAFPCRLRADESNAALALRWFVHMLLWGGLLAALWSVHRWSAVESNLRSPWPALHRFWLPLLALSTYLLGWISVGLWHALQRETASAWPDIDATWDDALAALVRSGIDAHRTPVFLVLGPLPREFPDAMASQGVAPLSLFPGAAFRVFAQPSAILLACDSLSSLATLGHSGSLRTDDNATGRLRHLCHLLRRDRAPHAPVQGIVLFVPFTSLNSDHATRQAVDACQTELRILRRTLGVETPIHVIMTGVDAAPVAPSDARRPLWRINFPPLPDLDPAEVASMVPLGVAALCREQLSQPAHACFRLDGASEDALNSNIRLYRWLSALHAWRPRLERLLVESTQNDQGEPGLLASCYLAPVNMEGEQAGDLIQALRADLLVHGRTIIWTAETVARAAKERRLACAGFAVVLLVLTVTALWLFHGLTWQT